MLFDKFMADLDTWARENCVEAIDWLQNTRTVSVEWLMLEKRVDENVVRILLEQTQTSVAFRLQGVCTEPIYRRVNDAGRAFVEKIVCLAGEHGVSLGEGVVDDFSAFTPTQKIALWQKRTQET